MNRPKWNTRWDNAIELGDMAVVMRASNHMDMRLLGCFACVVCFGNQAKHACDRKAYQHDHIKCARYLPAT